MAKIKKSKPHETKILLTKKILFGENSSDLPIYHWKTPASRLTDDSLAEVVLSSAPKRWVERVLLEEDLGDENRKVLTELLEADPFLRFRGDTLRSAREFHAVMSFLPPCDSEGEDIDLGLTEVPTERYRTRGEASVFWLVANFQGHWMPIPFGIQNFISFAGNSIEISTRVYMHAEEIEISFLFLDAAFVGKTAERALVDIGLRFATLQELRAGADTLGRAQVLMKSPGKIIRSKEGALGLSFQGSLTTAYRLTSEIGDLVVDGELEVDDNLSTRTLHILPYVRAFSLLNKRWVYVHVDAVEPVGKEEGAMDRVVIAPEIRSLLEASVRFGHNALAHHGGMVVLAAGPPGVGKTMTAEVLARQYGMPLYVLGIGELGTEVTQAEEVLTTVFARVRKWGAILLLDEGDIFLAARRENELQRSALVGIFLRRLDTYEGVMFLTTNRPDVLDPALLSRVTIRINYPDIVEDKSLQVWKLLIQGAGLETTEEDLQALSEIGLNGREARNALRVAMVQRMARGTTGVFTAGEIRNLLPNLSHRAREKSARF